MTDSEILVLSDELETSIKQLKLEVYRLCWYMRGGVDSYVLMHETDVEDLEILTNVIKDNIETTKKTGLPLL